MSSFDQASVVQDKFYTMFDFIFKPVLNWDGATEAQSWNLPVCVVHLSVSHFHHYQRCFILTVIITQWMVLITWHTVVRPYYISSWLCKEQNDLVSEIEMNLHFSFKYDIQRARGRVKYFCLKLFELLGTPWVQSQEE